jgi:hypothetical protein
MAAKSLGRVDFFFLKKKDAVQEYCFKKEGAKIGEQICCS